MNEFICGCVVFMVFVFVTCAVAGLIVDTVSARRYERKMQLLRATRIKRDPSVLFKYDGTK